MEDLTERQIIKGCRSGDAAAQRELYERYAATMYAICCRYVHDRTLAEDILHDGFITVFTKIGEFRGEGSFEGWCKRIFINTALGFLRKNNPVYGSDKIENIGTLELTATDVLDKMSEDELLATIATLPDGYRTILNLYAIEGYSHREIGEMLGINENTSRSQYFRARGRLIELLSVSDPPDRRFANEAKHQTKKKKKEFAGGTDS